MILCEYLLCLLFNELLDQSVNNNDDELDISALDAFCHLIKNEPDLSATAARLLAGKIQSINIKESLLALEALEGNLIKLSYKVRFIDLMIHYL